MTKSDSLSQKLQQSQCEQCGGSLVLTGVNLGDRLRCSICSSFFQFGKPRSKEVVDRGSFWSLYLGLASVVFLCFTGLPAMYLGIRGLLKMQHETPSRRERISAIVGTCFGAVFGVFGGLCVLGAGGIGLTFWWTFNNTTDPDEIVAMTREAVQIAIPDELKPIEAASTFNVFSKSVYADSSERAERNNVLEINHVKPMLKTNSKQIETKYDESTIGEKNEYRFKARDELEWEVDGQTHTITKIVRAKKLPGAKNDQDDSSSSSLTAADSQSTTEEISITYIALVINDRGRFGIVYIVRRPQSTISEEQIREIFRSVKTATDG